MSRARLGWVLLLAGFAGVLSNSDGESRADEPGPTAAGYEVPPVLDAREQLPAELLEGPDFRVDPRAPNDGYLNTYTLLTPWGSFEAYGEEMLRVRIDEVGALRQLAEVGRSEVFLDSLQGSLRDTWSSAARIVRRPVETLEGVPGSVKRLFVRTGRKLEESYEDLRELSDEIAEEVAENRREAEEADAARKTGEGENGEGGTTGGESTVANDGDTRDEDDGAFDKVGKEAARQARRELGVSRAQREWAHELGVDPYTDNQVLRQELERIARAAAAGRFAQKLVPSVAVVGELGKIDDLVWSHDRHELKKLNRRRLFTLGVDETVVDALLDNRAYTPSRVTGLISALLALDGTFGRYQLVRLAAGAISPEETFFFERGIELLVAYHRERGRFDEILTGPFWGGGLTLDGTFVLALPLDHLVWTREVAELFPEVSDHYGRNPRVKRRILWLTGITSERARRELEALGWEVESGQRPSRDPSMAGSSELGAAG